MMATDDTDRIYKLLEDIRDQLSELRQDTEKRLSALEERSSAERFKTIEERQRATEERVTTLRTEIKVYVAFAGTLGAAGAAIFTALILKLLHLG